MHMQNAVLWVDPRNRVIPSTGSLDHNPSASSFRIQIRLLQRGYVRSLLRFRSPQSGVKSMWLATSGAVYGTIRLVSPQAVCGKCRQ